MHAPPNRLSAGRLWYLKIASVFGAFSRLWQPHPPGSILLFERAKPMRFAEPADYQKLFQTLF